MSAPLRIEPPPQTAGPSWQDWEALRQQVVALTQEVAKLQRYVKNEIDHR
jgi:hypothetical protein